MTSLWDPRIIRKSLVLRKIERIRLQKEQLKGLQDFLKTIQNAEAVYHVINAVLKRALLFPRVYVGKKHHIFLEIDIDNIEILRKGTKSDKKILLTLGIEATVSIPINTRLLIASCI